MRRLDPPPAVAAGRPASPPATPAELVRAHQRAVWRYLRVLGADASEVDDLLQEVFVVAIRAGLVDRGDGGARTWLRTTARNTFLAHCRTRRRDRVALDPDAVERALDAYEGDDDGEGYRTALGDCLEQLPAPQRELVLSATGGDESLAGLAAQQGTSSEGLRSRLRRLRAALRDCVNRRMRDGS
ncbi:MAG: sigma-70 family RNA polymerase sigma factor [Planctomycetota bacterium]